MPNRTDPPNDQPKHTNRLIHETSPYLLQHAHNPVDWWPWGEEAFAEARRRDVPIFLSVGYATCYWCHVMERESFEDEATAAVMNKHFVSIKVDREQRPDVDDIYMSAVQLMTGSGGWPMSVMLEPEHLRPFWGATYIPDEARNGRPGFKQILLSITQAWHEQREEIIEQSERLAGAIIGHLGRQSEPVAVGRDQVSGAVAALLGRADRVNGGFGRRPKFPQPPMLMFLLDVLPSAGDEVTRRSVEQVLRLTLDHMAIGGIDDQVGGGFHRYATDEIWLVPHFEKMLYDNAQLAEVYASAGVILDDAFARRTARRTLDYVRREMTSPDGAFYSAQDAEVDGREGLNYIWTGEQIKAALGADDATFAMSVYGLDKGTNFRDPHHPDAEPANVLRLDDRPERVAERMGMTPGRFLARLDRINEALYAVRAGRKQPRLDDKVLAEWNGLMIAGLARCGTLLDEPAYVEAAAHAARFVLEHMTNGGLLRSYRDGRAAVPAFLDDYAQMTRGLLALHRATDEDTWLDRAGVLMAEAWSLFGDETSGGYFDTRAGQSDLFVRARTRHDGVISCGSSVMLHNLIDLYELTEDHVWLERAVRCLGSLSQAVAESPVGSVNATRGLFRLLSIDAGAIAGIGPTPTVKKPDESPVRVFADTDRVVVTEDEPGVFTLSIEVAEGYHINAAEPGQPNLIGLRVHLLAGSGVSVYADYPEGKPYGENGEIRVHTGRIEFRVVLERAGDWSNPVLGVTYQVCTDTECLAPTTAALDVHVAK